MSDYEMALYDINGLLKYWREIRTNPFFRQDNELCFMEEVKIMSEINRRLKQGDKWGILINAEASNE